MKTAMSGKPQSAADPTEPDVLIVWNEEVNKEIFYSKKHDAGTTKMAATSCFLIANLKKVGIFRFKLSVVF